MKVTALKIPDVKLIEPEIFEDERGYFFESFNQKKFNELTGLDINFVQDNQSMSEMGTLRGLHYQSPPNAQGKLVRAIQGEVFDVVVDVRKSSPTFGKWLGEILSADNKKQLWIPEGFAHGFMTLSDTAEFAYKTTNYYAPDLEQCISWDDPTLAIHWPLEAAHMKISIKDKQGRTFL